MAKSQTMMMRVLAIKVEMMMMMMKPKESKQRDGRSEAKRQKRSETAQKKGGCSSEMDFECELFVQKNIKCQGYSLLKINA